MSAVTCYLGIGSNQGDRLAMLRRAVQRVAAAPGIQVVRSSAVYETAPWGYLDQPPFLNAVIELTTTLGPLQLIIALQATERNLGRTTTWRWGPRQIDLDLLLYGDQCLTRRGLQVPHAAMHQRAFVLAPLRDLRPDYLGPNGAAIDNLLDRLEPEQPIRRLGDRLL